MAKGEMVEAKVSRKGAKSEPAGGGHVRMSIEHATNGGYIATHSPAMNGGEYKEPETHVFGKGQGHEFLAHVANHLGIKGEGAGDKDESED